MTYGAGHEETEEKAREMNDLVCNSRTGINRSSSKIAKFQVVTRRAPSLKDNLFKRKRLELGSDSKSTDPCTKPDDKKKGRSCMTCSIVSGKNISPEQWICGPDPRWNL